MQKGREDRRELRPRPQARRRLLERGRRIPPPSQPQASRRAFCDRDIRSAPCRSVQRPADAGAWPRQEPQKRASGSRGRADRSERQRRSHANILERELLQKEEEIYEDDDDIIYF